MNDITKYSLYDIIEDTKHLDTPTTCEYISSIVMNMKWYYEKQEFDNDIIDESQSKDISVMDYLIDFTKNKIN